jgi:PAS domain S-box-containing protein
MHIVGVADINPEAPGLEQARALGILTTEDYRDLFGIDGLNLIIELSGNPAVAMAIQDEKPSHIQLMDHTMARLFWDFIQLDDERLSAEKKAEERLKAERDKTTRILNRLSDSVIVMNADYVVENVNETFLEEFKLSRDEAIGKPCFENIFSRQTPCEDRFCPIANLSVETLQTGQKEHSFLRNGRRVYYDADYRPLIDEKGALTQWVVTLRDITHRRELEIDLEKSQKKYKDLFDNAREGLALFDENGCIVESNFSFAAMLGHAKDELEHMKISDVAESYSKRILSENLDGLKVLGFTVVEMDFVKQNGDVLPVEASITWLADEGVFRIMVRDIGIEKKLEESRRLYSERLEKEVRERTQDLKASQEEAQRQKNTAEGIIYGSPTPMFVIDREHKVAYWNKACEKLTGFPSEEVIGTDRHWEPFYDRKKPLLADVIVDGNLNTLKKVIEKMHLSTSSVVEDGYETEYFVSRLGERGTHLYISAAPIKDDAGEIQGAIVTYQDVSERVKMTEELKASEEEARRQRRNAEGIISGTPIPMFVLDKNHKITSWNKACEQLTGFRSEEMIGTDRQWEPFFPEKRKVLADLIVEDDTETMWKLYKNMNLRRSSMLEGAYEAEHFFPHLGEHGTHLYFNGAPIRDDAGNIQGAIITYQDFSERVRMIEDIERREIFVQNLIQNSIDGIIATDATGKIVIFNRGACQILGYAPEEILNKMSYPDLLSEATGAAIRRTFYGSDYGPPGKIVNMETEFFNKSEARIPVRLSGTLLYEDGKEVGSVVFIQDLREIHKLQREKEQAERMGAIGRTVAGVAHYIKNILNGLQGGAYVVNSALTKKDLMLVEKGWDMVERNIDQINTIVTDMLIYSSEREPSYAWVNPNEVVIEILELMWERAKLSGVSFERRLDKNLTPVAMDKTAIHNCLLNLVSNAVDACTLGGLTGRKSLVTVETDKPAGWGVRFKVTDNGIGMDKAAQQRVFTDFFTTKGYKGTGLGLPVTQKIVKEHGGKLSFSSLPGQGTSFSILLPEKNPDGH